jgi:hypothetical protein
VRRTDSKSEALHAGQFPAATAGAETAGVASVAEAFGAGTATAPPPIAAVVFMQSLIFHYLETDVPCGLH